MSEERRISSEDLALFAMQLLPQDEMAEVAAAVSRSAETRQELAEIQGDLAAYAHTADMHSPPALARERLMRQVAREKKAIPINRPATQEIRAAEQEKGPVNSASVTDSARVESEAYYKSSAKSAEGIGFGGYSSVEQAKPGVVGKVLPWVGWAVAAGLAVVTGNLYHQRDAMRNVVVSQASRLDQVTADAAAAREVLDAMTDSSAMRVTLMKTGAAPPPPMGRATYVASKGALIFLASNLEPLAPQKTYELWLIPAGEGQSPIPAGMFHPDAQGNASVIMPPLPKGVEAKTFGVTVEDEGGSATPTMPIVMAGE